MKPINLTPIILFAFFSLSCITSQGQTAPASNQPLSDSSKANVITVNSNVPDVLNLDRGTIRFLATSKDTKGAFSVFEFKENPGYKTPLHLHPISDEAFYVIEGVLTVNVNGNINKYPAGSYVLVPRGTPHGQGNFGTTPIRILITFTPSAFEEFFMDRVELFKIMKPDNPEFMDRYNELRKKHAKYQTILGTWDVEK